MLAACALLIASLAPAPPDFDRLPVSLDDVRAFEGHGIDRETAYQLWILALNHRDVREMAVRWNNAPEVYAAWSAEAHWRSQCWSLLDDVLRCYQDEPIRLRKLRELLRMIGPDAYYAGAMPMPIPSYKAAE